ncbi:MAG: FtsX-like permease family protein [Jiangellaceae bacterium]
MAAVRSWFRLDLRRRWRSLVVLALLVALAAGTVMTTVAGARRGASAGERLLAQTLPPDIIVVPNQPGFDWDAVRALPEVEALTTILLSSYQIEGVPPEVASEQPAPPADSEATRTIERPVVLRGRLADPARSDEVVITPAFAESTDKDVGDSLTFHLYSPDQADAYFLENVEPGEPEGPRVESTIVGVVRSFWYGDETQGDSGSAFPSAGFFTAYEDNLLGAERGAYLNALIRLEGGEAAIPSFTRSLAALTGQPDIDVWNVAEDVRHFQQVSRFEADGLLVFALAAAVAAVFLVGLAIARYATSTVTELRLLGAVGMTPVQTRWAAVAGPAIAGGVGALLGVAGAIVASRWFPIGTASLVEPAPGVDVDPSVQGVGLAAVAVLVVLGALIAAAFAERTLGSAAMPRRSAVAAVASRAGLPVPLVVGIRFALEPGRGRQAVPVRPALVGAVFGALGVLAAFTFSSGVSDAAAQPERFGVVHQLEAFVGLNGVDFIPTEQAFAAIADVPVVAGVNDTRAGVAGMDDATVAVLSYDPVGEPLGYVLTDGRLPQTAAEVTLGPASATALGAGLGDTIELTDPAGAAALTVVGIGFMPEMSHNDYTSGALVTADGYDAVFTDETGTAFKFHTGHVALEPGSDPADVAARVEEATAPIVAAAAIAAGADPADVSDVPGIELAPPAPPTTLAEIQQIRTLPLVLAGFLALLALGAVGHALATAVRRRRHDVAVLRALGMTRRQSRWMVVTQATVLALVGVAVGIPLGIALGRTVWRYVAESMPVFYVPPVAVLALALALPVALLAASLLAAWPSHRAATLRIGHVLRAE